MHCDHCLYECRHNRVGYLSNQDLIRFLDKNLTDTEFVNYCGGETFLHPKWREQLEILGNYGFENIRIVTNGIKLYSKKNMMSKTLSSFIDFAFQYSKINITLLISDDKYHRRELAKRGLKPINIFNEVKFYLDHEGVSNVTLEEDYRDKIINKIVPLGRALRNEIFDHDGICMLDTDFKDEIIPEITLDPYGRIYACCNAKGYIGHVNAPASVLKERLSRIKPQVSCLKCIYKSLDKIKEKEDIYV